MKPKIAYPHFFTFVLPVRIGGILLIGSILLPSSCGKKDKVGPAPAISSFTPAGGINGTTVTISGANFGAGIADNMVTFNGAKATVLSASSTILSVKVPLGAGIGKIAVKVSNKTDSSGNDFQYLAVVTTLAGDTIPDFLDATGTAARFNDPVGLVVDAAGNILVADAGNHRIRKITPNGVVTTLAGTGTPGKKDGAGTIAEFKKPVGIAVDGSGNILVAERDNNMIRKITLTGEVNVFAGTTGGFKDDQGTAARFFGPFGIATDAAGNMYIGDCYNNRIRKITPSGMVSTLAGSGDADFQDGAGGSAKFNRPLGMAVDASGNVYVADYLNSRIRKITAAGVVSTLAGDGTPGHRDGAGAQAQFIAPEGIAVDAKGNLYVADTGTGLVRKITPAGVVSTLAGSAQGINGDGDADKIRFDYPFGIAVNAAGVVFVGCESGVIRKIQ